MFEIILYLHISPVHFFSTKGSMGLKFTGVVGYCLAFQIEYKSFIGFMYICSVVYICFMCFCYPFCSSRFHGMI